MLILVEFNELCPTLLREYMDSGKLRNFQLFFQSSTAFTTDAGEEPPNLEPWIQWVTVHSGMPFAEHGVFHLGDGAKLQKKCLAEVLSDAGVPVGVFGSMNLNYKRLNGYLIPDPWDKQGVATPPWAQTFYQTVARQVKDSSGDKGLSKKDVANLGWFLVRRAFSLRTMKAIAGQLLRERADLGVKWQRAILLDRIQYDVFRKLNRKFKVRFATFFCNSTAHFQHYYWRNMQPDLFAVPPAESDHVSLASAILLGYQAMDALLGRMFRDYPGATLMLCTGLSQQPWLDTTKCTYRPVNFAEFLNYAGVSLPSEAIKPVMAEQFFLECGSADVAQKTQMRLEELRLDGEPLMSVQREGTSLFAGCSITRADVSDSRVRGAADAGTVRFGDFFHMVHSMRSGRHHPDGVFWVRTGKHAVVSQKVALTTIAPTILAKLGVKAPAHMSSAPLAV